MIVSSGFGHDPGASVDGLLGRVAEWQTRTVQVRVSVRTWGFNSPLAHSSLGGFAGPRQLVRQPAEVVEAQLVQLRLREVDDLFVGEVRDEDIDLADLRFELTDAPGESHDLIALLAGDLLRTVQLRGAGTAMAEVGSVGGPQDV